jgi:cbb3-type cytochrome oxidase maturation protein
MIVIFLLIPLSIVVASVFLLGFIWAVRSGQYEDTSTPPMRALMEESQTEKTEKSEKSEECEKANP